MSQSAVAEYAATKASFVDGIVTIRRGEPEDLSGLPATQFPLLILEVGSPQPKRLTFEAGGSGQIQITYKLDLRCWLGPADMEPGDAQMAFLGIAEELLKAFVADSSLGGTCDDAQVVQVADNLSENMYRKQQAPPEYGLRLQVTEYSTVAGS